MAYLYRLIGSAALLLLSAVSFAGTIESVPMLQEPAPATYKWRGDTSQQGSKYWGSAQDACAWAVNIAYGYGSGVYTARTSDDQYECLVNSPPAPFGGFHAGTVYRVMTCIPIGGAPGDTCPVVQSCPAGYFGPTAGLCYREQCADGTYKQPGTCPAVNQCATLAGKSAGAWEIEGLTSGPKQVCDDEKSSGDPAAPGCLATGDPWGCVRFGKETTYHCSVNMKYTGAKCLGSATGSTDVPGTGTSPAPSPGTSASTTECPPGTYKGTVNGSTVCAKPDTNDTTVSSKTETNTTTNPDGSTTTTDVTTTTECDIDGCTTSTTTEKTDIPAGGGTGTTQTTTQDGSCTRGSPGCGDEEDPSSFGGSCAAAFSCDGDAIFCAVALEQHKRNCALFVDSSPESELYQSEKGKTGAQYTSDAVALGAGSFSQANALGGAAQCISDKVVTVWNQQVTLPFSQICATLQHLGTVLVFVSFLLAYRIVSRG